MNHPQEVCLNGRIVPFSEANVSVEDRGLQFADGLYEVVRVYEGRFFELGRHLERLRRGAAFMEIPIEPYLSELRASSESLVARSGLRDATLVVQITRGLAPRTHAPWRGLEPTRIAYIRDASAPSQNAVESGIRTITVKDTRWGHCDIKGIGLVPNILAKQRALDAGAQDAIFVRDGMALEASAANLFGVFGGIVRTSPESQRILAGITRAVVLEFCAAVGIPVELVDIPTGRLAEADEAFITGTSDEVTPVVRVDDRVLGRGEVGPITRRLIEAYSCATQRLFGNRASKPAP